jgi:chromosome segregation ATPase
MNRGSRYCKRRRGGDGLAMCLLTLVLLLSGCAPLMQGLTGGEGAKKFRDAGTAFEQGKYGEARASYQALAEDPSDPRRAEQSQFNAAYLLVYYDNPDKDYSGAAREFEEFLVRYPSGTLAGEARSWKDVLRSFEQTKINELLKEVDALTKKMEALTKELQNAHADGEAGARERDLLLTEKNGLTRKVDELLNDKDGLIKEKAALLKERDGLANDNIGLRKKIVLLTREKEALARAKEKLEKSLHELTMVDVKMEKKRKKVK